jgi:hypothetical protein
LIQSPRPGEVLVSVPPFGTLIDLHPQLNPVFGGLLLRGVRVQRDAVDWSLDGHQPTALESDAIAQARSELQQRCARARQIAQELEQAIRRSPRDATMVRVSPELLGQLGGRLTATSISMGSAKALKDALPRAAAAVQRAVQCGDFAVRDGRAKLFGWCFLPPGDGIDPPLPKPRVMLQHMFESLGSPNECHRFDWSVEGGGRSVSLFVGDSPKELEDTAQRLTLSTDSTDAGEWRVALDRLREGELCRARVRWTGGDVDSNVVQVPRSEKPGPSVGPTPVEPPVFIDPPPPPPPPPPAELPTLQLSYRQELADTGHRFEQRIDWICDDAIDSIELVRVDSNLWQSKAGPVRIDRDTRSGFWQFVGGALEPDTEYQALAQCDAGEVLSNRIRIPDRPPKALGWWDRWRLRLWRWWALWGPCALCRRMGIGCALPGCASRGCATGCLSGLLGLLALFLLSLLLRSCSVDAPSVGGWWDSMWDFSKNGRLPEPPPPPPPPVPPTPEPRLKPGEFTP